MPTAKWGEGAKQLPNKRWGEGCCFIGSNLHYLTERGSGSDAVYKQWTLLHVFLILDTLFCLMNCWYFWNSPFYIRKKVKRAWSSQPSIPSHDFFTLGTLAMIWCSHLLKENLWLDITLSHNRPIIWLACVFHPALLHFKSNPFSNFRLEHPLMHSPQCCLCNQPFLVYIIFGCTIQGQALATFSWLYWEHKQSS